MNTMKRTNNLEHSVNSVLALFIFDCMLGTINPGYGNL